MYLVVTGSVQSVDLSKQNQDAPRVAGSRSTRKRQRRLRRRNRKRKKRGLKRQRKKMTGETGKNILTLFFLAIFTILPKHGRLGKLVLSHLTKIFTCKTEYGG